MNRKVRCQLINYSLIYIYIYIHILCDDMMRKVSISYYGTVMLSAIMARQVLRRDTQLTKCEDCKSLSVLINV